MDWPAGPVPACLTDTTVAWWKVATCSRPAWGLVLKQRWTVPWASSWPDIDRGICRQEAKRVGHGLVPPTTTAVFEARPRQELQVVSSLVKVPSFWVSIWWLFLGLSPPGQLLNSCRRQCTFWVGRLDTSSFGLCQLDSCSSQLSRL